MAFEFPTDNAPEKIKKSLEENINYLRQCIQAQQQYIEQFNNGLTQATQNSVKARKAKLEKHDQILDLLDIPITKKPGSPDIKPIQVNKRIVTPLPPPPKGGFKAEPGISTEVFENILSVIRHEGRSYETTPKTYAIHKEEELRDMLLGHLNGYFNGAATGETFRRSGKTDIRVEDTERAAFVAECKIWRGAKQLTEAIDQLLGYLTWRDCKSSIIIYNKHNSQFSEIIKQIPDVFKEHPRFAKEQSSDQAGEWRFVLRSKNDDARLIYCHIFAFDLFVEKEK